MSISSNPPLRPRMGCTTAMFGGPLETRLTAIKQAGFSETEIFHKDLFFDMRGIDYSVDLIKNSGLRVSCFQCLRDYEGMPEESKARSLQVAANLMEQMSWIGSDLLILCTNVLPHSTFDRLHILKDLEVMAELARKRNVRMAWEPVCMAKWLPDYRDAWSIVNELDHDHFGIMLDSCHVFAPGFPVEDIEEIDPRKILLVEINDIPRTSLPLTSVSRHYRLFPGDGVAPLRNFVRNLERIGYQGVYSLELFNDHYARTDLRPAAEIANEGAKKLEDLLAEVFLDGCERISPLTTG